MSKRDIKDGSKGRDDIAIIGMASHFPHASDLYTFWENIINKRDALVDVATQSEAEYWRKEDFYDPDVNAIDKTYAYKAGFVPTIDFNPLEFKIPPAIVASISNAQLFALHVAKHVMQDAGLGDEDNLHVDKSRIGVILGGSGNGNTSFSLAARQQGPHIRRIMIKAGLSEGVADDIITRVKDLCLEWNEDSFPGFLGNVTCGRIASHFDLGGASYMVDAACASSLAAIRAAIKELQSGSCDAVLTGGVNLENSAFSFLCFSKTPALSKRNESRPFDADADGIMLGDGIGLLMLKRLEDAKRDGNKIYAVIRGIEASSDGKAKSMFAPHVEGQIKALKRTYEQAGISPAQIQLVEAHGTGTSSGDGTELKSLRAVFDEHALPAKSVAIGSIKSQIGHTRCAAGAASMIKAALALYHKVLPPTINVSQPTSLLVDEQCPFYINSEPRPWMRPSNGEPRRAALSAFGFGGTNFHAILEEYQDEPQDAYRFNQQIVTILLDARTPASLIHRCEALLARFHEVPAALAMQEHLARQNIGDLTAPQARLLFVTENAEQAKVLLATATERLKQCSDRGWDHPHGIYYRPSACDISGKVVALFPGQGSQYVNMARDIANDYPEMRRALEMLDKQTVPLCGQRFSSVVYPPPAFSEVERQQQHLNLTNTRYAQPALGSVSAGYFTILKKNGFSPDFVAGHSYGELTALWAAGVLNNDDFYRASIARGQAISEAVEAGDGGAMLAASIAPDARAALCKNFPSIFIANDNSPDQVVFGGATTDIHAFAEMLKAQQIPCRLLSVSAAFHTPFVQGACEPFRQSLKGICFSNAKYPVFSSASTTVYGNKPADFANQLVEQLCAPVRFRETIEAIYQQGGRLFVEIGPKGVLGKLVADILKGREHQIISVNPDDKGEERVQFARAQAKLLAEGVHLTSFDNYARPRPLLKEKKAPLTYSLGGGFFISDSIRARRQRALRDGDTASVERFINERASASTPPLKAPEKSSDVPTPALLVQQNISSRIRKRNDVMTQNNHADKLEINDLLQAQNVTNQLHEQFQLNQQAYIQLMDSLFNKQYALLEKFQDNENFSAMLSSLSQSMHLVDKNLALYHANHERYFAMQQQVLQSEQAVTSHGVTLSPSSAPIIPSVPINSFANSVNLSPANVSSEGNMRQTIENMPRTAAISPSVEKLSHSQVVENRLHQKPQMPVQITEQEIVTILLQIVSERTGYPQEMIDTEMDLEADLGIDSIKRLEILGSLMEQLADGNEEDFGGQAPGGLENTDLDSLNNIQKIAAFFSKSIEEYAPDVSVSHIKPGVVEQPVDNTAPVLNENIRSSEQRSSLDQHKPVAIFTEIEILTHLLAIVSDRTGYPQEMIDVDMDLESDLGIDSIKRLEILGAIIELLGNDQHAPEDINQSAGLENLEVESLNSIRKMAAFFVNMAERSLSDSSAMGSQTEQANEVVLDKEVDNAVIQNVITHKAGNPTLGFMISTADVQNNRDKNVLSVNEPILSSSGGQSTLQNAANNVARYQVVSKSLGSPDKDRRVFSDSRHWLVVDEGKTIVDEVVKALKKQNQRVTVLSLDFCGKKSKKNIKDTQRFSLASPDENALENVIGDIEQQCQVIDNVIYLQMPAEKCERLADAFIPQQYLSLETTFLLARALQTRFNRADTLAGRFFVVNRGDGALGVSDNAGITAFLAHGVSGLTKSLNYEWENALCRTVDLDVRLKPDEAVKRLFDELQDYDTALAEVGCGLQGARMTLTLRQSPVKSTKSLTVNHDDVFIVTGGARGITAQCIIEMARRTGARFVLLGRTDITKPEPEWAQGCRTSNDRKAAAIAYLQAQKLQPTPVKIDSMVSTLQYVDDINETLRQITAAGAQAHYLHCDITDRQQLADAVRKAKSLFGPVTGIIHGAGNLADKYISKKTLDDLRLVFNVKVKGLENLCKEVEMNSLRYLLLFSSVSGYFGNAGQTDYAMANEVLNKFAWLTQKQPNLLVRAINWGPWDSGMVNDSLKRAYDARNMVVIPGDVGATHFVDEFLMCEGKQVIIGGNDYRALHPIVPLKVSEEIVSVITPESHPFLKHHVINGNPVLPATAAISWMVHLCESRFPGYRLRQVANFSVLNGVVFNGQETGSYTTILTPAENMSVANDTPAISVIITSQQKERFVKHYEATIYLTKTPEEYIYESPAVDLASRVPLSASLYGDMRDGSLLFHGDEFRGIEEVVQIDDESLILKCRLGRSEDELTSVLSDNFNLFIQDVALQLPLLWLMQRSDEAGLPGAIGKIEQYKALSFNCPFYAAMHIKQRRAGSLISEITLFDESGLVYCRLQDVKFTTSSGLRMRLTQTDSEQI